MTGSETKLARSRIYLIAVVVAAIFAAGLALPDVESQTANRRTRAAPAESAQAPTDAAAAQSAAESCDLGDFNCAVLAECKVYLNPNATAENRAYFPRCVNQRARSIATERQQVYAARIDVKGKEARLYLAKHYGADDNFGDWCGEDLWGKIEYPQDYSVLPALAKTVVAALNESLSARCPRAKTVDLLLYTYTTEYGPRKVAFDSNYLRAYRDGGVWNVNLHPKYVEKLQAQANLRALWSMISSPTQLGYFMGMVRYNDAAANSAKARYAQYAHEGNVCRMREAVKHCYVSTHGRRAMADRSAVR